SRKLIAGNAFRFGVIAYFAILLVRYCLLAVFFAGRCCSDRLPSDLSPFCESLHICREIRSL
ncbi:hypothetical protein, partial [Aeromonas veronii]|uniref:hypothetical protein n=1 Tax=Aeromonas veronii TaxID=654 RepID=UPI001F46FA03